MNVGGNIHYLINKHTRKQVNILGGLRVVLHLFQKNQKNHFKKGKYEKKKMNYFYEISYTNWSEILNV